MLRGSFCRKQNLDQSTLRFLLDGERIEDSATANSLDLENNGIIEAFVEMQGGGLPGRKGLSEDEVKKLLNRYKQIKIYLLRHFTVKIKTKRKMKIKHG